MVLAVLGAAGLMAGAAGLIMATADGNGAFAGRHGTWIVLGGLVALMLWLSKRRGRIPFGPFMLAGAWIAILMPR